MTLHIWPTNHDVLGRALDALAMDPRGPSVQVLCRRDGCSLGIARTTANGPLFFSRPWAVERPLTHRIFVDGHGELGRRQTLRAGEALTTPIHTSGKPLDPDERHGSVALLALLPTMVQDYPDLLVRCAHGDAVLSRHDVIAWLRAGKAPKVKPSYPRREYERPSLGRHAERIPTQRTHESRSWTGDPGGAVQPRPHDGELDAFLASAHARRGPVGE